MGVAKLGLFGAYVGLMEGFFEFGREGVKQKKGSNVIDTAASKGNAGEGIAYTTILKQNLASIHVGM